MNIGANGTDLIKKFEGLRLHAYQCSANVWTIGYGHTQGVRPGDIIIQEEADKFLQLDIVESEHAVNQRVSVPLTQNQFDALVSFVFNVGVGHFSKSTLLKKINADDYDGCAQEFLRWVHVGGVATAGLIKRREAEQALFLK
ncbi:lysozyme [Serratia sp. NPDC078593]|uniref:lysozyme n=1 Tax=unclassified Serratia (in: enterobacteria) TaxID=2647522 RepID=UPI0037D72059